ncbi:MAG: tetratricopeptide repeat protein [Paramuribaculum sp.]|nr:tetratricopeptide repeat protein [Paramuribaculum sp.]
MKKLPIFIAIAASAAMGVTRANAGVNSPDAAGYMTRGIAMYNDRNYDGCLDQLLQLRQLNPTEAQSEDALYYIAMSTLYCGDDEALGMLQTFAELYGGSTRIPQVIAAMGDYHFTRGAYGSALKEYAKVNPKTLSGDIRDNTEYRTAYSHMMLGENDAALREFDSLAKHGGKYGAASKFYIAYIHYSQGDYATALKEWEAVDTSTEPGCAAPYYMSQIYFMRSDYAKASSLARRVLADGRVPQFSAEANRIAGESLFNLGKRNDALPFLWQYAALTQDPKPSAFYMLGVSEYELGHYDDAIPLLQKAVNMPDALGQSACLYLGQCYVKRGNTDAALLLFERAYKMDCVNSVTETAFYNYIVALMDGGRSPFARTVNMLEEFLNRFPESQYSPEIRELALNGYLSDQDYASVLRLTSNSTAQNSTVARHARQQALYMLGNRDYTAGKYASALDLFNEGATIKGGNRALAAQCVLRAAACQYDMGEYSRAKASYSSYINSAGRDNENLPLAYYGLGYAQYMLEDYSNSLQSFLNVRKTAHSSETRLRVDASNRAGDCEYMLSHFGRAQDYYAEAYSIDPATGDYAMYRQALMKGYARDHKGKIAMLDEVINRYSTSSLVPAAMLEQAEAYVALGQNNNAITTYQQLVQAYPSTSHGRNGYLQLAITQMSAGERRNAIETYKKVIYTYPSSEEAKVAVDDLKRIYAADGRLGELADFVNSVPNAPHIENSELDASAFLAAEEDYIDRSSSNKLKEYLSDFPHGTYEPQALYYLAENAVEHGNSREALEYATRIVISHPHSEVAEDAILIKAKSEFALNKKEVAYASYSNLEERAAGAHTLQEARLGMMRTAIDLKMWQEALLATDKLLGTSASGGASLNEIEFNRALALDRTGNHDDAYKIWQDLAKTPESDYGAMSAVYLGESLMKQNKLSEAYTTVNNMINAEPSNQYWLARAFITLSDILRLQGQVFEANEYLKSLKSNYPGSESDIFEMIDTRLNNA